MRKKILIILFVISLLVSGCQRGDLKISIVHAGQEAPHDGYFINQTWWLYAGQPVPDDGYVVWIKGTEPNDLFE